jgi:hypothetical protein
MCPVLGLGLRTVPSDRYGRTIDGQVMVRFNHLPSVKSAQQISNGYGTGMEIAVVR